MLSLGPRNGRVLLRGAVVLVVGIAALVLLLRSDRRAGAPERAGASPTGSNSPQSAEPGAVEPEDPPAEARGVARPPDADSTAPKPASGVRGRIVAHDGTPVAGAWAWMGTADATRMPRFAFSDAEGRFVLAHEAGAHTLHARSIASGRVERDVRIPAAGVVDEGDLVLPAGLELRGLVLDRHAKPCEGLRIAAKKSGAASGGKEGFVRGHKVLFDMSEAVTDAEGRFLLAGLEPVPYDVVPDHVTFERLHFEPERHRGLLPHERERGTEIGFRLLPEILVRGRVVDAATRRPVTRFFVDTTATESADGSFECVPFAGSGFTIEARGYRDWSCDEGRMRDLANAGPCTVELQPDPDVGTLRLLVRDAEGAPIAGASVQSFGATAVIEKTGPDGALELAGVRAGGFEIQVWADGWTEARAELQLATGATLEREFRLRRAAAVELRIRDPNGLVAERAVIDVRTADGAQLPWRWRYAHRQGTRAWTEEVAMTTDTERRLALGSAEGRITGLPPGGYTLHVSAPGMADAQVRIEVDAAGPALFHVGLSPAAPAPR